MKAVIKAPDDPVPQFEALVFEQVVEIDIEGEYLPFMDIVPNLPAEAPGRRKDTNQLRNDWFLLLQVFVERRAFFVYQPTRRNSLLQRVLRPHGYHSHLRQWPAVLH